MWRKSELLENCENGATPLLKGDIVEIINPKLKSFGLQGTIVCCDDDTIYCTDDIIISVEIKLNNNTKVIHVKHSNLKFVSGDRPSFYDHFDTSPVHVGRVHLHQDDMILYIMKPLTDNAGNTVPGFIELHRTLIVFEVLREGGHNPMVFPIIGEVMSSLRFPRKDNSSRYVQLSEQEYNTALDSQRVAQENKKKQSAKYVISFEEPSTHPRMMRIMHYTCDDMKSNTLIVSGSELDESINRLVNRGISINSIDIYKLGDKVDFSVKIDIDL